MPPRPQFPRQRFEFPRILRQPPRQRDQGFPFAGRARALAGAFQQLDAKLRFQRLDLRRQRRLRDAEPRGGAAEMPFLGHGQEMPKAANQAEIHGRSPARMVPCLRFSGRAIRNPYRAACPIGMDDETRAAHKGGVMPTAGLREER